MTDPQTLAAAVARGDRRALARAITLVESAREDHRPRAEALMATLPEGPCALRLGMSGTPGAGKSTLIEALGMRLAGRGSRVAVLAVDPSSQRSGGSILGDKTRMERLSREGGAFIRPSPAGGQLGGVARRTREAVRLCEAAGFDVVIVETVGVGQSETLVAEMTDVFALVLAPHGGDDLQGVKRGVMEAADLILVNKADRDPAAAAHTQGDYASALRLMRRRAMDPEGYPRVMTVSALTGAGLAEAWDAVERLWSWRRDEGHLQRLRAEQRLRWFEAEFMALALARLHRDGRLAGDLREAVAAGRLSPPEAARRALGGA
ncbi:LAO/AO transport system kinase [Rubellimicrobium aerolatum]|nr:LAO/AO transport system kinase [Rubellimicrobium aerolatum]